MLVLDTPSQETVGYMDKLTIKLVEDIVTSPKYGASLLAGDQLQDVERHYGKLAVFAIWKHDG